MAKVIDINKIKLERMYEEQLKNMFLLHTYTEDWNNKINNKESVTNDNSTSR